MICDYSEFKASLTIEIMTVITIAAGAVLSIS